MLPPLGRTTVGIGGDPEAEYVRSMLTFKLGVPLFHFPADGEYTVTVDADRLRRELLSHHRIVLETAKTAKLHRARIIGDTEQVAFFSASAYDESREKARELLQRAHERAAAHRTADGTTDERR